MQPVFGSVPFPLPGGRAGQSLLELKLSPFVRVISTTLPGWQSASAFWLQCCPGAQVPKALRCSGFVDAFRQQALLNENSL